MTTATDSHFDALVCIDCYFANAYGYAAVEGGWQLPGNDDVLTIEPLNLLTDFAVRIESHVCADHDTDGETPCSFCGSSDYDNGITTYSTVECEGCGSPHAGERYRLRVVG